MPLAGVLGPDLLARRVGALHRHREPVRLGRRGGRVDRLADERPGRRTMSGPLLTTTETAESRGTCVSAAGSVRMTWPAGDGVAERVDLLRARAARSVIGGRGLVVASCRARSGPSTGAGPSETTSVTVVSGGALPAGTVPITASLGTVSSNWRSITDDEAAPARARPALRPPACRSRRAARTGFGPFEMTSFTVPPRPEEEAGLGVLAHDHARRVVRGALCETLTSSPSGWPWSGPTARSCPGGWAP